MKKKSPLSDETRTVASVMAALAETEELAKLLGRDLIPLKGVVLHARELVPIARGLTDVDVLVRDADAAHAVLSRAGYEQRETIDAVARTYRSPSGVVVDVHRALFRDGRFRLSATGVFARARDGDVLSGLSMDDRDLVAHLLGKWVNDSAIADARGREVASVITQLTRDALHPAALAFHLGDVGMGRALRHLARVLTSPASDRALRRVVACLPDDRAAPFALRIAKRLAPSPLGKFALGETLTRSSRALIRAGLSRSARSRRPR